MLKNLIILEEKKEEKEKQREHLLLKLDEVYPF